MKKIISLCCLCFTVTFFVPARARGSDTWHPFVWRTARTSVAELLDDIESGTPGVSVYVTLPQFLERLRRQGHLLSSREELEAAITSVETCSWTEGNVPEIERVNDAGEFGIWHREDVAPCDPGEIFAYIAGTPAFSLYCGNVIHVLQDEGESEDEVTEEPPPEYRPDPPLPKRYRIRTVRTEGSVYPRWRAWIDTGSVVVSHTGSPITVIQESYQVLDVDVEGKEKE
ncbi:MAG: hypothetical protein COZ49_00810 [Candidatus Yonathbacteria bacterium CG_4_10_14_3_um_filter_47_65]|uniref:Uncharacterized protein n=1 Tax=Candidatus Yonathbacteria bacterium CG_4_9_14_0_8_um_filter_46_47 TaxID=1975106 RepID=A0A2M8D6L3_9BACT|nr:MAG: hypothetical protein COZ49_00810 [Candidatus Yonathbacteria bacterium CG_4_10_14_3_um_filter_47_65]PJB82519.1 MAG: hypothetical protein CO088_03350 [Candidatus Yonathbacteria bacterium CG_4_9_14_0_8_um_filter_46_47]PJC20874.1 MAG: hypothetical protein CO061_01250 [Candidatus Yonathbacteria bacterium CG_4_9_14_0_2_um_filter_47_74]